MKGKVASILLAFLLVASIPVTAFAAARANFSGKIWTNWPNSLGMGYYCTAARNDSGGNTIHKAEAWSYDSSLNIIAHGAADGNDEAVARSGKTKPNSGEGKYWEEDSNGNMIPGCLAKASFTAKAYEPSK